MKIIIDATGNIINLLCRDSLFIYQINIIFLILNFIRNVDRFIIQEPSSFISVMKNTNNFLISCIHKNLTVLLDFINNLFSADVLITIFSFKQNSNCIFVIRDIPTIRLIRYTLNTQLIKSSNLSSSLLNTFFLFIKAKSNFIGISDLIFS